jgi:hypothetical protein
MLGWQPWQEGLVTTLKLHFTRISNSPTANQKSSFLWGLLLPIGIAERLARFDAFLILRQAERVPVAAVFLAGAQGVVVAVAGFGGGEVEDVVWVGDVVVGDRGGRGEGAG